MGITSTPLLGSTIHSATRRRRTIIDGLDAGALVRAVRFPWAEQLVERFGTAEAATFEQTVLQVTSHSTYHRGQVNARLRGLGAELTPVDFIAWIWMKKPAADRAAL